MNRVGRGARSASNTHTRHAALDRRDAQGHPRKTSFGPWMWQVFRLLAGLRGLRGSILDVFGYLPERRMERRLLAEYEAMLDEIASSLTPAIRTRTSTP